jgi:putative transposase
MRRIDQLFTAWPFLGSRRIARMLGADGYPVNRKRVQQLMRHTGIAALGPKPRTSKPAPGHRIYPYLLRNAVVERPNQVGRRISPTSRSAAGSSIWLPSWIGRAAPCAWRLSNTMDVSFCVFALEEALAHFGKPEIFNTDQGSQFTGLAFTGVLERAGVRISMDGRGRWMDNVFIERLWRSLKHEDIYLKGYADGREARAGITSWIAFYNSWRPHQALAHRMPMAVWREGVTGAPGEQTVDMTLRLDNAVVHMPTASTTAADSTHRSVISGDRSTRTFQLTNRFRWSHRWGPLRHAIDS